MMAVEASLIAAIGSVALASLVGYVAPHAAKQAAVYRLREACKRKRVLALTYDDGPSVDLTPRVLDVLSASEATATFFLLGSKFASASPVVAAMAAAGHEVACHSENHLHAWKVWPWRAVADINRGYETLSPWLSRDAMFRPPYGKLSLATWLAICRRGARLGWWTIDSGDTHRALPDPQSISDRAARDGGGVVLMHDFDRGAERADFVLRTTELLLKTAKREGLTVCRLCDLWRRATIQETSAGNAA